MLALPNSAASTYTAGLGDLGPVSASLAINSFVLGASASSSQPITLPIQRSEALGNVIANFAGITYNSFGSYWWVVPQPVILIDGGGKSYTITTNYKRTASLLTLTVTYRAGSGGCTVPAHTLSAAAHFYQLPF